MPRDEETKFAFIYGMITFVAGAAIFIGALVVAAVPELNFFHKCLLPISCY